MSVNYSIFVKKPELTRTVKLALEQILNCELKLGKTGRRNFYGVRLLGLYINLIDNVPFSDDVIRFSQYGHQITVDFINGAFNKSYAQDLEQMASILIANMLSIKLKTE